MMKKVITALMILGALAAGTAQSNEDILVNNGGVESLRGASELDSVNKATALKRVLKDRAPIDRNYVHQPPLIPHSVRGYRVDLNSNKCLSCHGWKYAREAGATKISPTHFETRDGMTLSDVSPRRYFCMQCHVPQADAGQLVENKFAPVDSLGNPGSK